jgi:hypothetical protein
MVRLSDFQILDARDEIGDWELLGGATQPWPEELSNHDTYGPVASDGELMAPEEMN